MASFPAATANMASPITDAQIIARSIPETTIQSHSVLEVFLANDVQDFIQYWYGVHATRLTSSLAGSLIGAEVFILCTGHLFNRWDLMEKLNIPLSGELRLPRTATEKFAFVQKVRLTRWLSSNNQYEVYVDFLSESRAETLDLRKGLLPVYIFMA